MTALAVVCAARFFLELALLVGAAVLAWHTLPWRWVSSVLAVVAVAALWGTFLSPKAFLSLPEAAALALEAALFIGVGAGAGFREWALAGVAAWAAHRVARALLEG